MILCLETATNLCSVALCESGRVHGIRESGDSKSHASMLTVFIQELLKEKGLRTSDLQAVAVSKGPGSYTGLRIGVSAAKGIAYASSIPLIGIETTYSMFHGIREKYKNIENVVFCPMLDARRMEVYYAMYDINGKVIKAIAAEVINENSFDFVPASDKIIFFGDGSDKLKEVIRRHDVIFDEDFTISAAHLCFPSGEALREKKFEDVAYFEPFYLKDFITTVQKKNILGR